MIFFKKEDAKMNELKTPESTTEQKEALPVKKEKKKTPLPKQSRLVYSITQAVAWLVSKIAFKRKMLRNEIKDKKGPFVVIANHEAALDFVNLIGATRTPMTFVVSNSFYSTLPLKGPMDKIGVIPKQQFQTSLKDLTKMRRVIEEGRILVIYPAGLMCEDGRSTPIPAATYDFLKWLKTDVYMARTSGTYFTMPKWTKGIRRGTTFMDIYKLFDKEEIAAMDIPEIKEKTDKALDFDAYREQEILQVKYSHNDHIDGLENVLYMCPHCHSEFTISVTEHNTICCESCGFAEKSDKLGFLHKVGGEGEEIRYVSTWSKRIYNYTKRQIIRGELTELSSPVEIHMIPADKAKFQKAGEGEVRLTRDKLYLTGEVNGEALELALPTANFASLPFKPGKNMEVQHGEVIYRCYPGDGKLVMKFINMIKIFYELNTAKRALEQLSKKKNEPQKKANHTKSPKPKRPHRPRPKLEEKQRKKEEKRKKREMEEAAK